MIFRLIKPEWAQQDDPTTPRVVEGEFNASQLKSFNNSGYNIYYLPNYPSIYDPSKKVDGSQVDTFEYVFVDMDLKDKIYQSKDEFLEHILTFELTPNKIVDSGNGIHAYWKVSDLNAMDYLKIQRRLIRHFHTDEAVGQIFQLMRYPGYDNTKDKTHYKLCELIHEDNSKTYSGEDFDKVLDLLSKEDDEYCKRHFDKTYMIDRQELRIDDKIPLKFNTLLRESREVKEIWSGNTDDRSKGDYRLAHIMQAHGFTKNEALSVLVNTAKAIERAPIHRSSYASNIVDKIFTETNKPALLLSKTVSEILSKGTGDIKGTRFYCSNFLDNTAYGFRLGQVIGLVAGSGVGKTAMALNMFMGFVKNNPDYDHFFVPLEQPSNEIADRWRQLCGSNTALFEKVHIISNYDDDGSFRNLSLDEIKDYILHFQEVTNRKAGCVVIDHIGALKKKNAKGENQDLMDICHAMKAFAIKTNTMLVMQSQAPRQKAGIGDLELDKDAAYGTVYFESYCDYLISIWQPLKRCYIEEGCPTVTAYKFCKIRHKMQAKDVIKEDVCYRLFYEPASGVLRELTEYEEKAFDFFNKKCVNKRKQNRQTEVGEYRSVTNGKASSSNKAESVKGNGRVYQ